MPARRSMPTQLLTLLKEQRQVASRQQLARHGVTRSMVRHRIACGEWQEPIRGAFLLQTGAPNRRQRAELALAWSNHVAVLCGPTAASLGGLVGYDAECIHLLLPHHHQKTASPSWIVVHRTVRFDCVLHPVGRPARTTLADSIVMTAALRRRPEDAVAVLAAGVQQRCVSTAQWQVALERQWQLRHKEIMAACLVDIAGGVQSLPEWEFLLACRDAGLPKPVLQARRMLDGRRRYLDADWPEWGVSVEIDGQAHMELSRWMDDLDRSNALAIEGGLVLRFPALLIRTSPAAAMAVVRRALEARGWKARSG